MNHKHGLLTFSGILILFTVIYLPVLQGYYVYHDDYWGMAWNKLSCSDYKISKIMNELGRFIGGYLTCYVWMFVNTLSDARLARFINIFLLSILAFTTYLWLCKNRIDRVPSLLLSIMIYTLPTFQSLVSIVNGIMHFLGLLLSIASVLLAYKALFTPLAFSVKLMLTTISAALLLLTLHMHQSFVLFYWPLIAVLLLRATLQSWRQWRLPIFYLFCVNLFAQIVFFILFIAFYATPHAIGYSGGINASPALYAEKLGWFFRGPLLDALNLWNIFPLKTIAAAVAALLISGLLMESVGIYRNSAESLLKRLSFIFSKILLLLSLFPLCMLPYLLIPRNLAFYRSLTGLSPLIVILLFFGVVNISNFFIGSDKVKERLLFITLGLACLTGIFYAHTNVKNYIVIPQALEFGYIKNMLQQADLSKIKQIHVIHSEMGVPLYSREVRYDEFGTSATSYPWDIINIIKAALIDMGKDPNLDIVISEAVKGKPFEIYSSSILFIDMTRLDYSP